MSEDLPVKAVDLLVLVAVSVLGGSVIASWTLSPQLTPNFAVAVFSGTVMLAFFLFIPVMGIRLFIEERAEENRNS